MSESREKLNKQTEEKNKNLAIAAAVAMHGQRAEDIIILDLRKLIDYADFFVIASASSMSRMRGVAKAAEKAMLKSKSRKLNHPDRETGWSLLDYGDVIIHVFDIEARDFYRIEDLWGDAPRVEWEDHLPQPKNAAN